MAIFRTDALSGLKIDKATENLVRWNVIAALATLAVRGPPGHAVVRPVARLALLRPHARGRSCHKRYRAHGRRRRDVHLLRAPEGRPPLLSRGNTLRRRRAPGLYRLLRQHPALEEGRRGQAPTAAGRLRPARGPRHRGPYAPARRR